MQYDYFLYGCLQEKVYQNWPANVKELKNLIRVQSNMVETIRNSIDEFYYRQGLSRAERSFNICVNSPGDGVRKVFLTFVFPKDFYSFPSNHISKRKKKGYNEILFYTFSMSLHDIWSRWCKSKHVHFSSRRP